MNIKLRIIVFILQFLDFVANLLEKLFGIKFKKITEETVLKGEMSVQILLNLNISFVLCHHQRCQ